MPERKAAATDGTTLITCDGAVPLTTANVIDLTSRPYHTRVYCARGFDDIKPIAEELLSRLPEARNRQQNGVSGMFNTRGHFYNLTIKWGKTIVDFCDVRNITRDVDIMDSAADFGGATPLETTWNIARHMLECDLQGTTIGGVAMRDYIDGDYRRFRERFPPLAPETYRDMRAAYFGAYVEADCGEYGDAVSYDVNSMYPSIMRDMPLPYGEPVWYNGEYEYDKDMPLHIDVRVFDAELRRGGRPVLTNLMPLWGHDGANRMTTTCGAVSMPLTDVDWETVCENYRVQVYEHIGGWKFHATRGYFYNYVDKWYSVKQHETGTRKRVAKLMLNSLVGKFGASLGRPVLRPHMRNGALAFDAEATDMAKSLAYVPVAAYVNAYGRRMLSRAIRANASRVIYADTDSMILRGIDKPDGIECDDGKLGAWSNDYRFRRLRILGARKYCGVLDDGSQVMRLSGVRRTEPIVYDEFLPGARHANDYGHDFVL